jgi:hypothetical protein
VTSKRVGKTPKVAKAAAARGSERPKGAARATAAKKVQAPGAPPAVRAARRAIFIDVENTSSEEALSEVLEGLKIERAVHPTEVTAVGNWRAVGQRLGRHLASLGAQLVHSAPATGVKDWSDLWIAVAAGCWLGQAQPGDILEIVSNDRAFDAVGDAAAARGVIYRRLLHRRGAAPVPATEAKPAARRSRGGRRRRRRPSEHPLPTAPPPAEPTSAEPHGASREQMLAVIGRLTGGDPGRWVNLDVLERALKAEGFSRPPGSPRLVTRLRMLKEVEVDSHGRVHLVASVHAAARVGEEMGGAPANTPAAGSNAERSAPAKRRRRRRSKAGGGPAAGATAAIETQPPPSEP